MDRRRDKTAARRQVTDAVTDLGADVFRCALWQRPSRVDRAAERKPAAELAAEFDALLDGRAPSASIAMCGSGVTACHHLLAMAHAGRDGAALFTGSWSGWIEDPDRPIATGDT